MQLKVELLQSNFVLENGKFAMGDALDFCGKIAGVCYAKEGFSQLKNENKEKTDKRIDMTLGSGHHSVYDHVQINFNLQNIPKILAMILNNEHQYTTSEKSARYTPIVRTVDSIITEKEEQLYNKWIEIFKVKIAEKYSDIYNDTKIQKLAQENARYLVTVFMPTEMIYTTTLRQINYIASYMQQYIDNVKNTRDSFTKKLSNYMQEFINCLENVNVLDIRLLKNEKYRKLSLFGENLDEIKPYFGEVYSTTYKGSFAQLAQAQRHRTINYQMELLSGKEFFIPPILEDDSLLVNEWLHDIDSVKGVNPQGELVKISENGTFDNFILKCKERLCTNAQLEIMNQQKKTLQQYKEALESANHRLAAVIEKYSHGARCTFPDFTCTSICTFKEGKALTRKI